MALFRWAQPFDPDFPLAVVDYRTTGESDRMHWHDYLEIALCREGTGRFLFGRTAEPIRPGDVFVVDDAHPHVALPDAGGCLRLQLVLFRPELVAPPGCRAFESGYLAPFRPAGGAPTPRIAADDPVAAEVASAIDDLATIADGAGPADRHLLDADLRRLLAILLGRRCPGSTAADRADAALRVQIRPILSYVEAHPRERLTLDDVARVVHLSPSRIRHVFRAGSGVGFKEYTTRVRVEEAKRLLLSTDLSVAAVAERVGYSNVHQFYRVFRRYAALLPAEYRRYYSGSVRSSDVS